VNDRNDDDEACVELEDGEEIGAALFLFIILATIVEDLSFVAVSFKQL
jgi:hypothetical protein